MAKRPPARALTNEALRKTLAIRADRLRASESENLADPRAQVAGVLSSTPLPATVLASDEPIPPIEPIWCFWLDAAHLADMTTAFAARQVNAPNASRRIPKIELPPRVLEALRQWLGDHHDGTRAAARAANYAAHYGLHLPVRGGVVKSTPFLDAFHAALIEAVRYTHAPRTTDANVLLYLLRRLHIHLARTASLVVDGLEPSQVFPRLRASLSLGRADLLLVQWILALAPISDALRGHILVPYPEKWMPPLDRLRQLTRTIDSLSLFYFDLAAASETLLLSIRLGDWTRSPASAATTWATFWQDEIARYLIAYQEVTNVRLA
jgi:hypothetical protein